MQTLSKLRRMSAEHVMNTLGHLKDADRPPVAVPVNTPLTLQRPPQANVSRYDSLRAVEVSHVQ